MTWVAGLGLGGWVGEAPAVEAASAVEAWVAAAALVAAAESSKSSHRSSPRVTKNKTGNSKERDRVLRKLSGFPRDSFGGNKGSDFVAILKRANYIRTLRDGLGPRET